MSNELGIHTNIKKGTLILRLIGSVNATNASHIMEKVKNDHHLFRNVTIDASELDYISSAGIRQIMMIKAITSAKQGKTTMINMNKEIEDVLKTVGLFDELTQ